MATNKKCFQHNVVNCRKFNEHMAPDPKIEEAWARNELAWKIDIALADNNKILDPDERIEEALRIVGEFAARFHYTLTYELKAKEK